jgi:hypothetical protein
MKRASGPMPSPIQVRKAMTSCRVTRSIASIASTSAGPMEAARGAPFSRITRAASAGMVPICAMASAASASISNQIRKRSSGDQIAAICGRV